MCVSLRVHLVFWKKQKQKTYLPVYRNVVYCTWVTEADDTWQVIDIVFLGVTLGFWVALHEILLLSFLYCRFTSLLEAGWRLWPATLFSLSNLLINRFITNSHFMAHSICTGPRVAGNKLTLCFHSGCAKELKLALAHPARQMANNCTLLR